MSNKDEIRIEWEGLKELEEEFERMTDEFEKILQEEYGKLAMLAEEGARKLAPRLRGDLETSISFGKPQRIDGGVEVTGGSNLPYALRQHEQPEGYQRGDRTLNKPAWRGYQPGRKYLENAIRAIEEDYNKTNERILERVLGGGR